ncbi:MAG: HD domain-containing protein [Clostridia bacterium]|nr:HD domain-containing protein [Clostridia bacterium]
MAIKLKNDDEKIKTILDFYKLTTKLKDTVRSGWKLWGVKRERLESVAEHIFGTCMLALAIWSETLPEINISEVLTMLALHETEEIIIGDITIHDDPQKLKLKEQGQKAVLKIFENLVAKDAYFKLIKEFDEQSTPEAIFAKKCDKLECDLMARLYSDEGSVKKENLKDERVADAVKKFEKKDITDVADYFIIADKKYFTDDDIFKKINKHIEGKKIWAKKK